MNFKKSKLDIECEIRIMVEDAFRSSLYSTLPYMDYVPQTSHIIDSLIIAQSSSIAAAMRVLMDNIYTDQEFESDIGLSGDDDKTN